MARYLKAPKCHWPACDRVMFLLNETDGFWFFQCECGCSRALTKPSARASSMYQNYQNSVEQERSRQRYLSSRPGFSLPSQGAAR